MANAMLNSAGRSGLGDFALAERSDRLGGKRPRMRSADAELTPLTLQRLRAESHRALRNSPVSRSIVKSLRTYYVGHGVSVKPRSGDVEWNKRATKYYKRWCKSCRLDGDQARQSMTQLQHLIIDEGIPSGDIGFLATVDSSGQVKVQPIEAALICNPPLGPGGTGSVSTGLGGSMGTAGDTGLSVLIGDGRGGTLRLTLPAGHTITEGVEVDAVGRAVAYYVTRYRGGNGEVSRSAVDFSRITADGFFLLANASRVQTRGTPGLASSLALAQYLVRTVTATVLSAEVQSNQSVYIETEVNAPIAPGPTAGVLSGAAALAGQVGGEVESVGGQERVVREMEGGLEIHLQPGQKAAMPQASQPNPNLPGFVYLLLRIICGEYSLPVEVVLADMSPSNFHSSRAAIYLAVEAGNLWQRVTLRPLLEWMWRLCIGTAIARGDLPAVEDWDVVEPMGCGRPMLDPADDFKGLADAVAGNVIPMEWIAANLHGMELDEFLDACEAGKKGMAKRNISPPLMPGSATDGVSAIGNEEKDQSGTGGGAGGGAAQV